ncbi:hypothetical protein [Leadbetterella sp. DM7]|uniref:hypothetical protein n=1 Tax=Leadbetterella sp. DM7 TaxID=3235085 RepID=UPI00349E9716
MELQLDSLRNNQDFFKEILNNINFYDRVVYLKERYPYYKNGKRFYDFNKLPDKNEKKSIIEKTLKGVGYPIDFRKQEWVFSLNKEKDNFITIGRIKIDESSIGGTIGVYYKEEEPQFLIWGNLFDNLIQKFNGYENETYRFCALNNIDIDHITLEIIKIFEDFSNEFYHKIKTWNYN